MHVALGSLRAHKEAGPTAEKKNKVDAGGPSMDDPILPRGYIARLEAIQQEP